MQVIPTGSVGIAGIDGSRMGDNRIRRRNCAGEKAGAFEFVTIKQGLVGSDVIRRVEFVHDCLHHYKCGTVNVVRHVIAIAPTTIGGTAGSKQRTNVRFIGRNEIDGCCHFLGVKCVGARVSLEGNDTIFDFRCAQGGSPRHMLLESSKRRLQVSAKR